jgi:hypothetical protein
MRRTAHEGCDWALLAAFALTAILGTWTSALLINDGTFLLSVGWLGDAWDLYFNQLSERSVSTMVSFGPAWLARWAFGLSSGAYMALAHILYFAALLGLWLAIRLVEPHRAFSRLYLAFALALAYFPTELLVAVGFWTIWLAFIAEPTRSRSAIVVATACFAPALCFSHPITALMSLLYLVVGGALAVAGRPFPRHTLVAAAAMAVLVIAGYFVTSAFLSPSNPTIATLHATARYDYINPIWMIGTLAVFPVLAALWFLLLAPGVESTGLRWRSLSAAVIVVAIFGLWFAANGTSLLTYLFARHSATHVLALALALALAGPAVRWLERARRPLMFYAAIAAVAAVSYNIDLVLFSRFVDRHLAAGLTDVDTLPPADWPRLRKRAAIDTSTFFKWAAGPDYVRDVVVPDYQRYIHSLAFYSFFRSDRRSVLFHALPAGYWTPFECPPVERALARARDDLDRQFLKFLSERYCVR